MRGGGGLRRVVAAASTRRLAAAFVFGALLVGPLGRVQVHASVATVAAATAATYGTVTATLSGSWHWDITNPTYLTPYETSRSESITFSESVTARVPKCALTPDPGCFNDPTDQSSTTADVVGQPTISIKDATAAVTFQTAVPTRTYFTPCSATFTAGTVSPGAGSPIRIFFSLQQISVTAVPPTASPWMVSSSSNPDCAFTSLSFTSPWPMPWSYEPVPDLKSVLPYKKTYSVTPEQAASGVTGTATFTVTGGATPCTQAAASALARTGRGLACPKLFVFLNGTNVTDAARRVDPGERVTLEGKFFEDDARPKHPTTPGGVALASPDWSGIVPDQSTDPTTTTAGCGSDPCAIADYDPFANTNQVRYLSPDVTKQSSLTFYWLDSTDPTDEVTVTATYKSKQYSASFDATFPDPVHGTFVVTATHSCLTPGFLLPTRIAPYPPALSLGLNDSPSCATKPGIRWTGMIASGVPGWEAYMQLVGTCKWQKTKPPLVIHTLGGTKCSEVSTTPPTTGTATMFSKIRQRNGGKLKLDNFMPYHRPGQPEAEYIKPVGTVIANTDSPTMSLVATTPTNTHVHEAQPKGMERWFVARTYLMYCAAPHYATCGDYLHATGHTPKFATKAPPYIWTSVARIEWRYSAGATCDPSSTPTPHWQLTLSSDTYSPHSIPMDQNPLRATVAHSSTFGGGHYTNPRGLPAGSYTSCTTWWLQHPTTPWFS